VFRYSGEKKRKLVFLILAVAILFLGSLRMLVPDSLFSDPYATVVEDEQGNLLGGIIAPDGQWRFPPSDSVPQRFITCITTFEDRFFYFHPGINPGALFRALKQNIKAGEIVSGGSTLTMQVMRMSRKGKPRNVWQKGIESLLSVGVELKFSKSEILNIYASHAPFGSNVVGLEAAAWRYFGRKPSELSWAETATLAVLPNAPALIHPGRNRHLLMHKRNRLLSMLLDRGKIDSLTHILALAEPLPGEPNAIPSAAPHLVERLYSKYPQKKMTATLNPALQHQVNQLMKRYQTVLEANHIYNAAVLVTEIESGKIIAYGGNLSHPNHPEHSPDVDIITSRRSSGSVLKPLLYAALLDEGAILPTTLVADVPTRIGDYMPENFSRSFDGAVPARDALARSLNVPAVRMLKQYGLEKFYHLLKKCSFSTLDFPASHYGLSLILGGAEITMWDLTSIYASLARMLNHYNNSEAEYDTGDFFYPVLINASDQLPQNMNNVPPLSYAAVYEMFVAMAEVTRPGAEAYWRSFSSTRKIAWKTGTSFGHRDAWAIGITPDYSVTVWVGNADGEGRPGLTGISAAAPLLFKIFNVLPASTWFESPLDELIPINICRQSGYKASRNCQQTDTLHFPSAGRKTIPCPYHKRIHLDESMLHRVNSRCYPVHKMNHTSWFVLPPAMEWFYKKLHPEYRELPPWQSGCIDTYDTEVMQIIYPTPGAELYVPLEVDGQRGKIVFEATHRQEQSTLYWHIDQQFIGTTSYFHQIEVQPDEGRHILTLTDESGNVLERRFKIIKSQ